MLSWLLLYLRGVVFLSLLLTGSSQTFAFDIPKSDILLHIVAQCVDPSKVNYCANCMLPRVDKGCGDILECKKTNEVWALTEKYVAIRDIKMCGCPTGFVHGLAMPRAVITGVEDSSREEGIWQFAWDVGLERIESQSLALAVNPKSERTQNQLHIHILRLDKNARESIFQYASERVNNLNNIWAKAHELAWSKGMIDYGVLVIKESVNQYLVLVTHQSPEAAFTIWGCQ